MQLFQYAVIKHPNAKEKKDGKKSELLVDITTVLAADDRAVGLMAARAIPEAEVENLDNIEVVVRPF